MHRKAIGFILTFGGTFVGAVVILVWNYALWIPEYLLLAHVYKLDLVLVIVLTAVSAFPKLQEPRLAPKVAHKSVCSLVLTSFTALKSGWKV